MKENIFIACDTTNINKIKKIIKYTQTKKINIGYKFGLEFFNSKFGRSYISKLKNKQIWLDLKLFDISNTVKSSIYALKDLKNINYLTVHVSGGYEMLVAARKAATKINKKLKILGVTVLTSFSEQSLKKTGHTRSIKNIVVKQAKLAKSAGLHGIVCSGHEVKLIKNICKRMEIITPGIRLLGDKDHDQKRVMTPIEAFKNGATGIVIGRSITNNNIKKNLEKLLKSII